MEENEQQERDIVEKTARLVFTPEFIPYYGEIKKEFEITHIATLIYGFIRFYLYKNDSQFYFTNKQMGEILDVSEDRAGKCFMELQKKGLVEVKYIVKSGGGKVRFVDFVYGRTVKNNCSEQLKTPVPNGYNQPLLYINNNSINNNNIKVKKERHFSLEEITQEDIEQIASDYKVSVGLVQYNLEALKNYCASKGKRYKDYKATLRNFVLRDIKGKIEGRTNEQKRVSIGDIE